MQILTRLIIGAVSLGLWYCFLMDPCSDIQDHCGNWVFSCRSIILTNGINDINRTALFVLLLRVLMHLPKR